MKKYKLLSLIFTALLLTALVPVPAALALEEPPLDAEAAILVEMNTNQVLYTKNADEKMYPASLTKIMTALLTVEALEDGRISLYDAVTASENCTFDLTDDGSTAGITAGEVMTVSDLLYCTLLASANEACNILAEYISGSISAFVVAMNARAKELGCTGTQFVNTHGLPDDDHYTTARDLSLITHEAAAYQLFMDICDTTTYTISATNLAQARHLSNTNALVNPESIYSDAYHYEYAQGIKTGFTSAAGYCLASTAVKGDFRILAVVMHSTVTGEGPAAVYGHFKDSIALYDWAFENFSFLEILSTTEQVTEVPITMGQREKVVLRPSASITALLPNDTDLKSFSRRVTIYAEQDGGGLQAPVSAGEVLGEVSITRDGVTYGTSPLTAATAVELSRAEYVKTQLRKTFDSTGFKIVVTVLVLLIAAYLALVVQYRVKYQRHKKQAQAARRASTPEPVDAPPPEPPQKWPTPRLAAPDAVSMPVMTTFTLPDLPAEGTTPGGDWDMPEDLEAVFAERRRAAAPPEAPPAAPLSEADRDYFEEIFGRKP